MAWEIDGRRPAAELSAAEIREKYEKERASFLAGIASTPPGGIVAIDRAATMFPSDFEWPEDRKTAAAEPSKAYSKHLTVGTLTADKIINAEGEEVSLVPTSLMHRLIDHLKELEEKVNEALSKTM
jgi:hypothetical protein